MFTKTVNFMEDLADITLLLALRKGLTVVLPLIITGALSLLILNIPSEWFHSLLTLVTGEYWKILCQVIQQGSFGIAALAVLISTSSAYSKLKKEQPGGERINSRVTSTVCLSCYFVMAMPLGGDIPSGFFSMGGGGFPLAITVSVIAPPLFIYGLRYFHISKFFNTGIGDTDCQDALSALPAAIITITVFGSIRIVMESYGISDLHMQAQRLFAAPFSDFSGSSLKYASGYIGMSQLLWFFGIHGPNTLYMVESNVLVPNLLENISNSAMGVSPCNIFTKPFFDAFVHTGGSGATLGLIIATLIRGKDISTRRIALVALLPALFNVNEVILFGLPVVLNPFYAIPFFLVPVAQTFVAYTATSLYLVPCTIANIHWTSPPILGGYVATGSIEGAILQIFCIAVGVLGYLPFVKLADRIHGRRFISSMKKLSAVASASTPGFLRKRCTDLPGYDGQLARALAYDLKKALERADQIYLEYQPQIDIIRQRAVGAEALVRWRHPIYGNIPPHVTVALAEDTDIINSLGMLVLSEACNQHMVLIEKGYDDVMISVNISVAQFKDMFLVEKIEKILSESGLEPRLLKIEVTETMALSTGMGTIEILSRLRDMGIMVAIDDFGMGHTSLRYLKEFPVETIKIDKSLTQETPDGINDHIVRSIASLCEALGVQIIVEGVETEKQLERFRALKCRFFQGYLFSRPLSGEAYIDYIESGNCLPHEEGNAIILR